MNRFNQLPADADVIPSQEGSIHVNNSTTTRDEDDDDEFVLVENGDQKITHHHHQTDQLHSLQHQVDHHVNRVNVDRIAEKKSSDKRRYVLMFITTVVFAVIIVLVVRSLSNPDDGNKKKNQSDGNGDQWNNQASPFITTESNLAQHRAHMLHAIDNKKIRSFSREYSKLPHLAGLKRNTDLAHKTAQFFREWGFDEVTEQVLPVTMTKLNRRAVSVLERQELSSEPPKVIHVCRLDEAINDSSSTAKMLVPPYVSLTEQEKEEFWSTLLPPMNGYSGSGRAEGPVVWANWGRDEDYKLLDKLGINLQGKIVVTRYGKIFRGNKVRLAQNRGAVGVLIVHDPGVVGPGIPGKTAGYPRKVFPEGPWAANWTVQRGSISLAEGDPSTFGWPSQNDPRAPRRENGELYDEAIMEGKPLPAIPVQPLGYGDAMKILENLASANPIPDSWKDTGFLSEFTAGGIGPSSKRFVRVEVDNELQVFNITNVVASIRGSLEPDRAILLGSHRDNWGNGGGTVDPISGHSTILEIARVLATHHKETGWRPRRTIQINSWDGEEESILGSDEFVETNVELLRQRCIAYLNLDTAVSGNTKFWADGSPLLQDLLELVAKETQVQLPGDIQNNNNNNNLKTPSSSSTPSVSLFSMMATPEEGRTSSFSSPGAGTDHVGFYSLAGVPVLDVSFYNGGDENFYESAYHSVMDSTYWMENFVDPEYQLHAALARLYLSIALRLSEPTLLPLNPQKYVKSIRGWVDQYQKNNAAVESVAALNVDWSFMDKAIQCFDQCATLHRKRIDHVELSLALLQAAQQKYSYSQALSVSPAQVFEIRALNDITFGVERVFLGEAKKETAQSWFRHVIYTPSAVNSYGSSTMPMIGDAIAEVVANTNSSSSSRNNPIKNKKKIEFAIGRIAQFIFRAGAFVNSSGVMPPNF